MRILNIFTSSCLIIKSGPYINPIGRFVEASGDLNIPMKAVHAILNSFVRTFLAAQQNDTGENKNDYVNPQYEDI